MNGEPSGVVAPRTQGTDAGAAGSDAACLRVGNACVRYGDLEVLRDVSFEVGANEIVSLVGRSGCGKTTVLRCVAGLLPLDEGSIRFEDQLVDRPLEGVCMVFQHFGLLPWKNVWRTRTSSPISPARSTGDPSRAPHKHGPHWGYISESGSSQQHAGTADHHP